MSGNGPIRKRGDFILEVLNPAQQEAVLHTNGPLRVLAGAGTGKTRVITCRIAHLLTRGVGPEEILAVTFTRKAAREMRERLADMIGTAAERMTISTFHSLGYRILKAHKDRITKHGCLKVCSAEEQILLARRILTELVDDDEPRARDLVREISQAKNSGNDFNKFMDAARTDKPPWFTEAYRRYEKLLRNLNAIDFDDLVRLPLDILEQSPRIRGTYQNRWRHILIDEYQDTNEMQCRLVRLLLGPDENICVVGDDDQSIYGFRGARVERILDFPREFREATTFTLKDNYRSSEQILALANAIIQQATKRHPKRLVSHVGSQERVHWHDSKDEETEVDFIAHQIDQLVRRENVPLDNIAILVRVHKNAHLLRRQLNERGVCCAIHTSA